MPLTPDIQAVLFDLDGTLRHNQPTSTIVFIDHAATIGAPVTPVTRLALLRWTHRYWAQSPELLADMQNYPEEDDFWTNYALRSLEILGASPELSLALAPRMSAYMKEEHHPVDWVPPEVFSALQNLKSAGYRLALLSNRSQPCDDLLAELGLLPYFELAMVAGQVNCWKPEACVFEFALDSLGLSAAQAVYVGDNYYADIIGAREAGLHPILIDPDGVFPDAECPVIRHMGELENVLRLL